MRSFVLAVLFVFEAISCRAQNRMFGLWSYVDKTSTYWEEIYTDSLFWVYSDELGILMRKYVLSNDTCLTHTYLDGTYYADYVITEASTNKIAYSLEGQKGVLRRIHATYDFNGIIQGDSVKRANYVEDYRKRKYRWESKHKKR